MINNRGLEVDKGKRYLKQITTPLCNPSEEPEHQTQRN
jgi:hypothetical protein